MSERYTTPSAGTLDWHVPLKNNFKKLDKDIEVRDTDANRHQHKPLSGRKYLATDTLNVYLGDGNQWTKVGNIGNNPEFESVNADWAVINDGGILKAIDSDGVQYSNSNHATGWQSLFDALSGGESIIFKGNFDIGSELTLKADQGSLIGAGIQVSSFSRPNSSDNNIFTTQNPDSNTLDGWTFRDFEIAGNDNNNTSGHNFTGAFRESRLINIWSHDTPGKTMWLQGTSSGQSVDDNVVHGCRLTFAGEQNLQLGGNPTSGGTAGGATEVSSCVLGDAGDANLRAQSQSQGLYRGNQIWTTSSFYCVRLRNCTDVAFIGNSVDPGSTGASGIGLDAANQDMQCITVANNVIKAPFDEAILVNANGNGILYSAITGNVANSAGGGTTSLVELLNSGSLEGTVINDNKGRGMGTDEYQVSGGPYLGVTINGKSTRSNYGGLPTYDGDGTTGRTITLGHTPTYVAIKGSDGTWYDVHGDFGTGYQHTDPSGELSITDLGITVGDNGNDSDPNTNNETYDLYYEV